MAHGPSSCGKINIGLRPATRVEAGPHSHVPSRRRPGAHRSNADLGYSDADRAESVRRIGEVALLMAGSGLVVIVALVSPFRRDRNAVRARFGSCPFVEVFVDTPLNVCESRDPKGQYKRARSGDLADFMGISSAD